MIGFRTIRQGERVAVWDMGGRVEHIDGPRRLFLFRRKLAFMALHSAAAGQYLTIHYKDGQAEHEARLQRTAHEERLRQREAEARRAREDQRLADELKVAHQRATNQERLSLLTAMQALQVDLTRYLVAQYQHPDRLIRVEGGKDRAQFHLHDR